jgi:hypothetical protein
LAIAVVSVSSKIKSGIYPCFAIARSARAAIFGWPIELGERLTLSTVPGALLKTSRRATTLRLELTAAEKADLMKYLKSL